MRVLIDGRDVPVQKNVVVILENVTGPVDGKANDQLHVVYTPDNVIKNHIWQLNTPLTSNPAQTSYAADTTAQAVANTCSIAS